MLTRVIDGWLDHLFDRPGAGSVTRVPETYVCVVSLVKMGAAIRDDAKNTDTYGGSGVRWR